MNTRYELWKNNENLDEGLKQELLNLDQESIEDAFSQDLEFGTAGIRGLLGVGSNRLNIYTIQKVTRGLATYLLNEYKNKKKITVAVAYDSRNFSYEFSIIVAKTLASYGIYTYIYDDVKPTPLLSYLVIEKDCDAGIMITASHNPKEYNGYKVYNRSGAQLNVDEADAVIKNIDSINNIFEFKYENNYLDYMTLISTDIEDKYIEDIKSIILNLDVDRDIKVVFTPEHGTSYTLIPKTFKRYGYNNLICVEEQMQPDGDFTNTKSANPEEIIAYEKAIEYAIENDADLIIANDPDADRLGVMYKDYTNNYKLLTGNQTGTLLIDYILNNKKINKNSIIYKTIVTGEMGSNIAQSKGVKIKELLTGFKFIGEQIELLDNKDDFIFGYEESYGYLIKPIVRDKDAIQAALLITEMAGYYKKQFNITIGEKLNDLYEKYGYYSEITHSISLSGNKGLKKIKDVMELVKKQPIEEVCGYKVEKVINYNQGIDNLPKANVFKYYIKNLGWFVFRPSGTEPKLKIYISIKQKDFKEAEELNHKIYEELIKKIGL